MSYIQIKLRVISFVFGLACVATLNLKADQTAPSTPPAAAAATSTTAPLTSPAALVPNMQHSAPPYGGQMALTAEENKILANARLELQKDPDIAAVNSEIKALLDKRSKLTEEKLEKISPEAEAILQKLKNQQEKMIAERRAQMEAMQAKATSQSVKSQLAKPISNSATSASATPSSAP